MVPILIVLGLVCSFVAGVVVGTLFTSELIRQWIIVMYKTGRSVVDIAVGVEQE